MARAQRAFAFERCKVLPSFPAFASGALLEPVLADSAALFYCSIQAIPRACLVGGVLAFDQ
jgi:hypothetical protein